MMQFLMSSLQASARPDCGGQRRSGVEGKSKYCLRWKLLKTGDESKASRSTALRIFIRGMRGLLGRGSEPPILQGLPPACRAFYERSRSRWRTDGGKKVWPARGGRDGLRFAGRADSIGGTY